MKVAPEVPGGAAERESFGNVFSEMAEGITTTARSLAEAVNRPFDRQNGPGPEDPPPDDPRPFEPEVVAPGEWPETTSFDLTGDGQIIPRPQPMPDDFAEYAAYHKNWTSDNPNDRYPPSYESWKKEQDPEWEPELKTLEMPEGLREIVMDCAGENGYISISVGSGLYPELIDRIGEMQQAAYGSMPDGWMDRASDRDDSTSVEDVFGQGAIGYGAIGAVPAVSGVAGGTIPSPEADGTSKQKVRSVREGLMEDLNRTSVRDKLEGRSNDDVVRRGVSSAEMTELWLSEQSPVRTAEWLPKEQAFMERMSEVTESDLDEMFADCSTPSLGDLVSDGTDPTFEDAVNGPDPNVDVNYDRELPEPEPELPDDCAGIDY